MRFRLAVLLFAACAAPAAAPAMAQGTACVEPTPPVPVDGAAATADQLRAAMADARNFMAQSDIYQNCLQAEVEAAKTQAAADGRPVDPAIEADAKAAIAASQKAKEKVGLAVNSSLTAYKQAHPN